MHLRTVFCNVDRYYLKIKFEIAQHLFQSKKKLQKEYVVFRITLQISCTCFIPKQALLLLSQSPHSDYVTR